MLRRYNYINKQFKHSLSLVVHGKLSVQLMLISRY